MYRLKVLKLETTEDLAESMLLNYFSDLIDCVSAICKYDIAIALIEDLVKHDVNIKRIEIADFEWNRYDREYQISIMDEELYCTPLFVYKKDGYKEDGYLDTYSDVIYVHQDCNSKLLKKLECRRMYEFSIDTFDTDDDDDVDDCITTYQSDSVTVNRDKLGRPTGFTKSWIDNDEDDIYSHSSYSFFSDNEETVRYMAEQFDIDL